MTTPTQQAIERTSDYLNGNDLARPGFDEIRLLLAHMAELTREKEKLVRLGKEYADANESLRKVAGASNLIQAEARRIRDDAEFAFTAALAKHQQTAD